MPAVGWELNCTVGQSIYICPLLQWWSQGSTIFYMVACSPPYTKTHENQVEDTWHLLTLIWKFYIIFANSISKNHITKVNPDSREGNVDSLSNGGVLKS